MPPKRFRDMAVMLSGKLPAGPPWPAREMEVASPKANVRCRVDERGTIVEIDHAMRQFRGRQFQDLTRWMQEDCRVHDGLRISELSVQTGDRGSVFTDTPGSP